MCLASNTVYTLYKSRRKEKDFTVYAPLVPNQTTAQWTDTLCPVLQLWIRSAEGWRGGQGEGTGTQQQQQDWANPYCGHGYVPLRFGWNVVMRMGTQQQDCAKKKILAQKKPQRFLSKKTQQKSLTTKKKKFCPNLKICRQFSFYFGERDMYCTRALGIFYQSEVTSLQVNTFQGNYRVIQTKKLWLPAQ